MSLQRLQERTGASFNPSYLEAIRLGEEESRRLQHGYFGTEHQILGLLTEGSNPTLISLGVSPAKFRLGVEFLVGRGTHSNPDPLSWTEKATQAAELSISEARRLQDQVLDTGHLLLGIIRLGDGIGVTVLENLGLSLGQIRQEEIRRRLDSSR